jgi:hypothetical protein
MMFNWTGELLYNTWQQKMEEQNVTTDLWQELEPADRQAWEKLAVAVNEES